MAAANDAMPTPDSTTYHRQRGEHGIRPFDTLPTGQLRAIRQTRSKVSPTALRFAGRAAGAPPGAGSPGTGIERSWQRIKSFENPYAASSMAKMAVSGWLIGSTPTRLTIDVTVPSASASTHAARCSRPR
jgi:hypothetical protein